MEHLFTGSRKLLLAICAVLALGVLVLEILRPYLYLAPDSFTYFVMARHAWDAHLLYSYSGVDHTTGIHPGFYFLLLPLYPLFGVLLPQWSLVVGTALVLAGSYALYRSAGFALAATVLFLALTPFGAGVTNNGMESSLLFFALCLLAAFFLKEGNEERRPLLLGCLLGFAVFARLDTIFLAMAVYGILFVRALITGGLGAFPVRKIFRTLALVSVPLCAVLALVFFLDIHYGASLLPVSGKIKSSFPQISPDWLRTFLSLKTFALSLAVSGAYLAWRLWKRRFLGVLMPALFLATLALYLYNGLFVSDIGAWYGALPFFSLALACGAWVSEDGAVLYERYAHRLFAPLLLLVLGGVLLWSHTALSGDDWISPHQRAAIFLDLYAHKGEAAGELKDGVFAFYSALPVYNLTGLGNNREYILALRNATIAEYFNAHAIRYVVGGTFGSGVQVPGSRVDFKACSAPIYDIGTVRIFGAADCGTDVSAAP